MSRSGYTPVPKYRKINQATLRNEDPAYVEEYKKRLRNNKAKANRKAKRDIMEQARTSSKPQKRDAYARIKTFYGDKEPTWDSLYIEGLSTPLKTYCPEVNKVKTTRELKDGRKVSGTYCARFELQKGKGGMYIHDKTYTERVAPKRKAKQRGYTYPTRGRRRVGM